MSDSTQKIALLILGWLLGLLSPVIVDAIKYRREAKRGRHAILAELDEVGTVLLFATYRTRQAAWNIDRPFLDWLRPKLVANPSPKAQRFLGMVDQLLAFPDNQIVAGAALMATAENKATLLQHYPAPLLDARVSALWTFDTTLQRQLLELHRNLALLDAIVDQSREFFRLTFNTLSDENYTRVSDNLKQSYSEYAERAKIIVDQIETLKPQPKK
jgi:hypothetical protein